MGISLPNACHQKDCLGYSFGSSILFWKVSLHFVNGRTGSTSSGVDLTFQWSFSATLRRSAADFNSGKDRRFPKSFTNQNEPGKSARWARATSPDYAQSRKLVESDWPRFLACRRVKLVSMLVACCFVLSFSISYKANICKWLKY